MRRNPPDHAREARARAAIDRGAMSYGFRPAKHDDLPMLRAWLETPEVARWWGEPDEQAALLREDLDEPLMRMWIVSYERHPFAYAQDYQVHSWQAPHLAHLPRGSRAIDDFIGVPEMIGRGHGSGFVRRHALRLIAEGAPAVAIDPAVDNHRARRAYHKAGFRGDEIVETDEGRGVLMLFDPAADG